MKIEKHNAKHPKWFTRYKNGLRILQKIIAAQPAISPISSVEGGGR